MFNKKIIIAVVFLIIAIVIINLGRKSKSDTNSVKVKIKNQVFYFEVADTDAKRSQGLSGRVSMYQNRGMLFKFNKKGLYTFWMKEMNFPLDFLWVEDNEIKDISKNIPPPPVGNPDNIKTIAPNTAVNSVIEINSGIIDRMKIEKGDKIEFIQ